MADPQQGEQPAEDLGTTLAEAGIVAEPPSARENETPAPQSEPAKPQDPPEQPAEDQEPAGKDPQDEAPPDPLEAWGNKVSGEKPAAEDTPPAGKDGAPEAGKKPDPGDKGKQPTKDAAKPAEAKEDEDLPRLPDEQWRKMPAEQRHAWSKLRQMARSRAAENKALKDELASHKGDAEAFRNFRQFQTETKLADAEVNDVLDIAAAIKAGDAKTVVPRLLATLDMLGYKPQAPAPTAPSLTDAQRKLLDEYGLSEDFQKASGGSQPPAPTSANPPAGQPPAPQNQPPVDPRAVAMQRAAEVERSVNADISAWWQERGINPTEAYRAALKQEMTQLIKGDPSRVPPGRRLPLVVEAHARLVEKARKQASAGTRLTNPIRSTGRVPAAAPGGAKAPDPLAAWASRH